MLPSRSLRPVGLAAIARIAPRAGRPARWYHCLTGSRFLKISEEVRDAVATGKPVVALETTIYTHGFPYPDNVELALLLESVVRENGGVPATIGILNGIARVGLDKDELVELAATAKTKTALKVSRRDLGYICGLGLTGKRLSGGTTISGTMVLAHLAGIRVFGTGGLGGVHRGGEISMDVSADLTELGRTPVAVVSSGCKSFLDTPRTLEYLETEGVCVGTFADGRDGPVDFPAFFTRESGIRSPKVFQNEAEAAAIIYAQSKLPVSSGILFANPVPLESSIAKADMDKIIDEAVKLADAEGYHGSDNTPFVLAKIRELSGGKSVAANEALVKSNVKRAARVAVELSRLETVVENNDDRTRVIAPVAPKPSPVPVVPLPQEELGTKLPDQNAHQQVDVLVAGSLAIDLSCDYAPLDRSKSSITPVPQTSNAAIISQSLGGVGHNVAIAAHYAGSSVLFCSIVANDLSGRAALATLEANEGLKTTGILVLPESSQVRSAQYIALNDAKKDLVIAMADMGIMELPESDLDFDGFWEPLIQRSKPRWIVLDANWTPSVLSKWTALAQKYDAKVAFEPVSTAKSCRIFTKDGDCPATVGQANTVPNNRINLAAPNKLELSAMYTRARESGLFDSSTWWQIIDAMSMSSAGSRDRLVAMTSASLVDEGIPQQSIQLLPFIPCIVTKLGAEGVLLAQLLRPGDPRLTAVESAPYILARAATATSSSSSTHDPLIGGVYLRLFRPAEKLSNEQIVSVNAAGDTLLGVVIAGLAGDGVGKGFRYRYVEDVIPIAQKASVKTLMSAGGVSRDVMGLRDALRGLPHLERKSI